jgi:hypothetical protein
MSGPITGEKRLKVAGNGREARVFQDFNAETRRPGERKVGERGFRGGLKPVS